MAALQGTVECAIHSCHTGDTRVAYDAKVTTQIDITRPFIAIRQDLEGGPFMRSMGEYLCNPLGEDLVDVAFSTGGFFSEDALGVIEARETRGRADAVPTGTGVRFSLSTRDEYDEFMCHWSIRYRTASGLVVADSFSASKRLSDAEQFDELPVIRGAGYVVPRCSF